MVMVIAGHRYSRFGAAPGPQMVPGRLSSDLWRHNTAAVDGLSPGVMGSHGQLINHIEATGAGPDFISSAYIALVPETDMEDAPQPQDCRPIPVLSSAYRLWSKTCFGEALDWQEKWVHPNVWGCRPKHGAEAMITDMTLLWTWKQIHLGNVIASWICPLISKRGIRLGTGRIHVGSHEATWCSRWFAQSIAWYLPVITKSFPVPWRLRPVLEGC